MSGHNPPHGRLGQPNTSWNSLQVPSYVPRQPQLAHMSSERPMVRSPLTWHTPPTHQDKMYRCTTGNLMNNLEMNPLLQGYGRNVSIPLGSVDLSLSSGSRSTPSPKATHGTVQPASGLAPQSCSSSTTLPSNIPSSSVYNLAADSGHHSTNHQLRTSTNPSGGVIQSTTSAAALKERMQGSSSLLGSGIGNSMNCFGSGMNSIGDSGGNGFGAGLTNRAANDPTTLVTGGLLIKDAKQINSEMEIKNGRDCFPHLPAADSAELVKEFIMQTMQNSNNLSVSPKRTSPARSTMQHMPSPTRSRSPPVNLLLGADCLNSINIPVPTVNASAGAATESTDSGNSSGPATSMGSVQPGSTGPPASAASLSANNRSASPITNSITSGEDSIDSLTGRSNPRRRRKPERTSKMNAAGGEVNAFFPLGKGIGDASVVDLESLRPGNVALGDISALAMEGINALSHGLTDIDGASCNSVVPQNNKHHRVHGNHTTPLGPALVQQHLQGNLIQSNTNSGSSKVNPSMHLSALSGNGSPAGLTNDDAKTVPNSGGIPLAGVVPNARKGSSATDASGYGAMEKVTANLPAEALINSIVNKGEKPFIGNGTAVIGMAAPERGSNGPLQNSGHGDKMVSRQRDKLNASDSSYEEVENKLEEMFAGLEEQPEKRTDSTLPVEPGSNINNGCHDIDSVNQLTANTRSLQPAAISDGDVLKQLSSDAIANEEMKDASLPDGSGASFGVVMKSGKKPLTPAQKRGNGSKSLLSEMVTSTPAAKRKRTPKKKSNAHENTCPFPSTEAPAAAGLIALAAKKKKVKKDKSTSVGGEPVGRSVSGMGRKGQMGKTAKGANKNNEQTSSSTVCPASAPSIEANGKYKGPYVQVKSDGSHTVINAPITEEDGEKAQSKTKKFGNSLNSSERSKIRGLHVSTLSTKYDADTTDTSWMCVFCKTGPHKFRLGDLFGPYIISTTSAEFQQSQVDMDYFSVKRTRDSFESQQAKHVREQQKMQLQELVGHKGKKRKNASGASIAVQSPGPSGSKVIALKQEKHADDHSHLATADMFYGMIKAGDSTYEVWTHEDCLVWAPGVYMVGTRIVGLEAAIWNCCRQQCDLCTHYGAVVSCLRQGCSSRAHFICAHKQNWKMSDQFQSFCETHADRQGSPKVQPTILQDASTLRPAAAHPAKQPRKEFKPDKNG